MELNDKVNIHRILTIAYYAELSNGRGLPLLLDGPPGGTKTSLVAQYAASQGLRFLHLSPAQKGEGFFGVTPCRGTDSRGRAMLQMPPPEEILAMADEGQGIILADELRTCPSNLRAAMLSIVQERMFGAFQLPPGIRVFAASNSAQESPGGAPLTGSVANRFCHVKMVDPSLDEFQQYFTRRSQTGYTSLSQSEMASLRKDSLALEAALTPLIASERPQAAAQVIAFARAGGGSASRRADAAYKGELRCQPLPTSPLVDGPWESPRSWGNVVEVLAVYRALRTIAEDKNKVFSKRGIKSPVSFENAENGDAELETILTGLVGPIASAFINWVIERDLPSPEAWLKGEVKFDRHTDADRVFATVNAAAGWICTLPIATAKEIETGKRRAEAFYSMSQAIAATFGADLVTGAVDNLNANAPKVLTEGKAATAAMLEQSKIAAASGD